MTVLRVLFGMVFAALAIVGATVVSSLAVILLYRGAVTFPAECGLVFGAAITGQSDPGPAIVRRVGGAAALWREGHVETLILSGGKGDAWRLSEAAVMRQEAIRNGVDGRDILSEDTARSTKENLERSRVIVDEHCGSVVLISDQYHIARIRLLAKRLGWTMIQTYGVPERPQRGESWSILRELAGYVYYAVGADAYFTFETYDDTSPMPESDIGAE